MVSIRRPTWWSVCSRNPAYTSIWRASTGLSSSGMSSQAVISSWRRVSSASSGITPSSFWRAKMRSRWASHPSSNCPAYLSAHSFGTWCGACVAPGAKYMKNGLSGISAFCWRTQLQARSARSSVRWYSPSFAPGGRSTGVVPSYSAGSHWLFSPPMKP